MTQDAQAAYAEAERRIAACAREGGQLDLSDLGRLAALPPQIAECEGLTVLDLKDTAISDLRPLEALTGLEWLYISGTNVADLAPIKGLKRLKSLWISRTQVTDLAPLSDLDGLMFLIADQTQITDLAPLANLEKLNRLFVVGTAIRDLAPLRLHPALSALDLSETPIDDLRPLLTLPELRGKVAANSPLAGVSFQNCAHCQADPQLAEIAEVVNVEIQEIDGSLDPQRNGSDGYGQHILIDGARPRTRALLDYLATLPPWPEPLPHQRPPTPPAAPTPAPLPRLVLTEDARIGLAPATPSTPEDPFKTRLYAALAEALPPLARFGNRNPEIARPAHKLQELIEAPFAQADLLGIHLEIASLTDQLALDPQRPAEERLDADCHAALLRVTRLGPPLTLGDPDVDQFEAQTRAYLRQDTPPELSAHEAQITRALAQGDHLTPAAQDLSATLAAALPQGRLVAYRAGFVRNAVLIVAGYAVAGVVGDTATTGFWWGYHWLVSHQVEILALADSWSSGGRVWAADVIARADALLSARPPRRD